MTAMIKTLAGALAFALITHVAVAQTTLTPSGPVTVTANGQIVENLRITANGQFAINVDSFSDVIIRNVEIMHQGANGIQGWNADRLRIENAHIVNTSADPTVDENNIFLFSSEDVVVIRARLRGGSAGIYALESPRANFSFLEGYNFRGPNPRGQLVQFNLSPAGVLEDFSVINSGDPAIAQPEDVISTFDSDNATIRRGLVDGNNSTHGVGVNFELSVVGLVEDVDTVRQGNGSFGAHNSSGITFRRTRARDNICVDQGRGPPASGGIVWSAFENVSGIRVEQSFYFNLCDGIAFDPNQFDVLDVTEQDFTLRDPIVLVFPWETPTGGDMTPPLLAWVFPTWNACLTRNQTVLLRTTATDEGGLQYVRLFYDGNTLLNEWVTPAPTMTAFEFSWKPTKNGAHVLSIVAQDLAGNMNTESVNIQVKSRC